MPSSTCLSESSPIRQHDVDNMSPEASAVRQKGRKDAQDVKAFFQLENERWYCKFCEYVFHLSIILAF
jgi:hypothetical protein